MWSSTRHSSSHSRSAMSRSESFMSMWWDLWRLWPVVRTRLPLMLFSLLLLSSSTRRVLIALEVDAVDAAAEEEEGAVIIVLGSLRSSRAMRSLAWASDSVRAAVVSFSSRY